MGFFHGWIFLAFATMVHLHRAPDALDVEVRRRRAADRPGRRAPRVRAHPARRRADHRRRAVKLDREPRSSPAPVAAVCAGMGDPDFYAALRPPRPRADPRCSCARRDGRRVDIHVRFTYTGQARPDRAAHRRPRPRDLGAAARRSTRDARSCTLYGRARGRRRPGDLRRARSRCTTPTATSACARSPASCASRCPSSARRAEKSLAPGIMRRLDLEAARPRRVPAGSTEPAWRGRRRSRSAGGGLRRLVSRTASQPATPASSGRRGYRNLQAASERADGR